MRKLKYTEIKTLREQLLKEQNYKCALSDMPLTPERAVVDHNHKNGRIRAVLDRGVNSLLGKIENGMAINLIDLERLHIMCLNLITYLKESEKDLLHPTHKTPEERKTRAKKRAQAKRKKNGTRRTPKK